MVIYHVEAKYHSCSPGETKIGLFKNLTERAKKRRGRKQLVATGSSCILHYLAPFFFIGQRKRRSGALRVKLCAAVQDTWAFPYVGQQSFLVITVRWAWDVLKQNKQKTTTLYSFIFFPLIFQLFGGFGKMHLRWRCKFTISLTDKPRLFWQHSHFHECSLLALLSFWVHLVLQNELWLSISRKSKWQM